MRETKAGERSRDSELLRLKDLRVRIDGGYPVDGVCLSIGSGELVALVGASGSGKTLTALATIGLLPPAATVESGSIRLAGYELLCMHEREWRRVRGRRIAMIFQEPMTSLNPVMTIGAQLIEAIKTGIGGSRAKARAAAVEALRAVQMPEPALRMHSYPHQLSGGMRQRAMIAMALACRPALLIADEPTTALDVTVQAGIVQLLQKIRKENNLAVLFITHDIALASETADRIVVMQRGKVVEDGQARQIVDAPTRSYTALLIEHCRKREAWRSART